jgi:hypothetical protein
VKLPFGFLVLTAVVAAGITGDALSGGPNQRGLDGTAALDRLVQVGRRPVPYEATRRLEASSAKLNESAWLEALTEYDSAGGFRYRVLDEGGSSRIRRRVLLPVLEAERQNSSLEEWRKAALSPDNYDFSPDIHPVDGMIKVQVAPRRRDVRLVDGAVWLSAQSGELIQLQGRLSKSPSFWVRWVDVTRRYTHLRGAIVPVVVESVADVRLAGVSTFSMRYHYAMVNGERLAPPAQPVFAVGLLSDPESPFANP